MVFYIYTVFYSVVCLVTCFSRTNCQCFYNDMFNDENENYENKHLNCDTIVSETVTIINEFKNGVPVHHFWNRSASACVNCVLCTTIAEVMEKEFASLGSEYAPNNAPSSAKLINKLRNFCDNNFKNFDLQEEKGQRFLLQLTKTAGHVTSEMDGKWALALKEMCTEFVNSSGEDLYIRWFYESRNRNFNMTDMLCRSYGIFHHCGNLPAFTKYPLMSYCF